MAFLLIFLCLFVVGLSAAPQSISPHVINGVPQAVQHACAVFAQNNPNGSGFFGGGSIISEIHVITAASLLVGATNIAVGFGNVLRSALDRRDTTVFTNHPQFNRTNLANDIGIIFFARANSIPIDGVTVRAIALPTAALSETVVSLAGFGYTQSNAVGPSDNLLVASLVTTDIATCNTHFGVEFTTHICAIGGESGVVPGLISNICPGDNGAGLYTGDGIITTTTTTTEEPTTEEPTTEEPTTETAFEEETEVIGEEGGEIEENTEDEYDEYPSIDEISINQVEPILYGIASAIGDYWICNPEDPRAYTEVFPLLDWILIITGL